MTVWTIGDLAGLPAGTRIRTNDGKTLTLVEAFGGHLWTKDPDAPGVLYSALVSWLPAVVL